MASTRPDRRGIRRRVCSHWAGTRETGHARKDTGRSRRTSPRTGARPVKKTWGDVKHFRKEEFDSPDAPGSGIHMDLEFVLLLDALRERLGVPLNINSGYRTTEHNRK